jgi:hypothetical protein
MIANYQELHTLLSKKIFEKEPNLHLIILKVPSTIESKWITDFLFIFSDPNSAFASAKDTLSVIFDKV